MARLRVRRARARAWLRRAGEEEKKKRVGLDRQVGG